jgi:hypothetical protein
MKNKTCYLIFAAVVFFAPAGASAETCTCPKKPELEESQLQSSAVFVGRVETQEDSVLRPQFTQVRVVVLRKFKWLEEFATNQSVLVYTPKDEASCGFKFQNGFDYLIFAKGNPAFLRIDTCSRTQVMENAQLDLQRLMRTIKTPEANPGAKP